jgi:hypothetical protein
MPWEAEGVPADPRSTRRVRIAFLFLLVVTIVGGYYAKDLGKLQESISARESQAALQGITDPAEIDAALKQHPSNKQLLLMATATRAANDTNAAIDKLTNDIEPPALANINNLGAASRNELEALQRDLKTAETNATTFMPRYIAILKAERDSVEKYAISLPVAKDTLGRLLDNIDKRQAEITAFTSKMLPARADSYRARGNFVAFLVAQAGAYKLVNGQLIFPFQRTVDRYNALADATTVAARRVAELEEERKGLLKSQQEAWRQFVSGK